MDYFIYFILTYCPLLLLVIFECIYVFINPLIDKDFDIRRVFDYRRMANVKTNIIKNLIGILILWTAYIGTCEVFYKVNEYTDFHDENGSGFIGYIALLFLLLSIYMLNSGMTERTVYKALLIIFFVSAPLILLISVINSYNISDHMELIALGYGAVFVISLVLFMHYWTKEDVR